jgi:hypothetical protein
MEGRCPVGFEMLAISGLAAGILYVGLRTFMRASYRYAEEV